MTREAIVGPLDEQLARRLERAIEQASSLLGKEMPDLEHAVDAVTAALAESGDGDPWEQATELHRLQLQLVQIGRAHV